MQEDVDLFLLHAALRHALTLNDFCERSLATQCCLHIASGGPHGDGYMITPNLQSVNLGSGALAPAGVWGESPSGVWGRAPAGCGAEPREENFGDFAFKKHAIYLRFYSELCSRESSLT